MTGFGAMIFAAGYGERLRPLTEEVAKPALPFLNIPMLAFSHYFLNQLALSSKVVNVHHRPETLIEALGQMEALSSVGRSGSSSPPMHISHEREALLGSGGGLKFAFEQGFFKGCDHVWLFNGDSVCLMPKPLSCLEQLQQRHLQESALATLLVVPHPQAGIDFGAVWVDDKGQIKDFGLKSSGPSLKPLHYSGIMLVSRSLFDFDLGKNIIYDGLLPAIQQRQAKVIVHIEPELLCLETGNPKDYELSQEICQKILRQASHPLRPHLKDILSSYSPR